MRQAIVIVGPRASGKSSFCEKAIALDTSMTLISRDKILIEEFGQTTLDSYSGGHEYALGKMWEQVRVHLRDSPNTKMILDCWSGDQRDRAYINKRLRAMKVKSIEAWYFITPVQQVEEWFWKKPGIARSSEMKNRQDKGLTFYLEDAPRRDHELFHELAKGIDSEEFDQVIRINPLIMRPEHVLRLQTSLNL
ncbi:hypothetical protein KW790_00020 [Candidatus Parcubacteria bacterium]|nr:hypothetical protein [Candidatus Parcubacteria bacterium]